MALGKVFRTQHIMLIALKITYLKYFKVTIKPLHVVVFTKVNPLSGLHMHTQDQNFLYIL